MEGESKSDLEARLEDILPEKRLGLNRKYDTIAHGFLDIEFGLGVTDSDYQVLDNMIDEACERIEIKPRYLPEIINVLETIGRIFEDKGFKYGNNLLLNTGLKNRNKKISCADYSVIYLSMAEVLNFPLKAATVPRHVFVRWCSSKDYINWETTDNARCFDEWYKLQFDISKESIEKGIFLRSLSRKEVYSIAYNHKGYFLDGIGKCKEAIENYDLALKLNPRHASVYNNKGFALDYLGEYEEAIENYDSALDLDPNCLLAHVNKRKTLNKLKRIKRKEKLVSIANRVIRFLY